MRKYIPIGPANMATVKTNSLTMTELKVISACRKAERERSHAGTAGAMLDFSEALGVVPSESSLSKLFFSLPIIRLAVIARNVLVGELVRRAGHRV